MTKQYQIEKQRALKRFREQVGKYQPSVQLVLPIAELCEQLQPGLLRMVKQVGVQCLEQMMNWEVEQLAGPPHHADAGRQVTRWGSEQGYCTLAGQKVPLQRPRVRDPRRREVALGSYALIQKASMQEEAVWQKIMHGLTARKYGEVVREFEEAYGIEKSTVSRHFVRASRAAWRKFEQRHFDQQFCVLMIDGKHFQHHQMITALGVDIRGQKVALGVSHGATENASLVRQLLENLQERGIDFQIPRLYVLDGSKALAKAVRQLAGPAAVIQRCQFHKRENVLAHLTESQQTLARRRLEGAYATLDHATARKALRQFHAELEKLNPSAAQSLAEGMEETITLHRLRLPGTLRRSLSTTNLIESAFSGVETVCRNVKRWRDGDHRLRWLASALMFYERRWNRIQGYRQLPLLIKELELDVLRPVVPRRHQGVA